MRPVLGDLTSEFERTTGHTVTIGFATAGVLADRIRVGKWQMSPYCRDPLWTRFSTRGRLFAAVKSS